MSEEALKTYDAAKETAELHLKRLVANVLRVLAGAGDPWEIEYQLPEAAYSMAAFVAAGDAVGTRSTLLGSNWWRTDWREFDREDYERWVIDGTVAISSAKEEIYTAAMRIVASRLFRQLTQESVASNVFSRGVDRLEAAHKVRNQYFELHP